MIDRDKIDLLNRAIDGEIESGEQKILDDLLISEPEARRLYDLFRSKMANLNNEMDVEPPVDLKQDIMDAIDRQRYQKESPDKRQKRWFMPFVEERKVKMSLAMAAGLVIGICLYPLLFTQPVIDPSIYGTIGIEQSEIEHVKSVQLDHAAGTIDLKQARQMIWLQFNLDIEENADFDIHFNQHDMYLFLVHPSQPEALKFNLSANILNLSTQRSFTLVFRQRSKPTGNLDISVQTTGEKRNEVRLSMNHNRR